MKNKKAMTVLAVLIVILAGCLRFYKLGQVPLSLDWDEASLGYNAYSLLKTGKDEFGNLLPINLRSFEDYKPALYSYLTIIPVGLFGLTEFSVRFVSALAGTLTVLVVYLTMRHAPYAAIAGFLLAISPWHLQFSRIAFEVNLGLFFFSLGVFFIFEVPPAGGTKRLGILSFLTSAVAFVLAMYSYHSFRLIVPVFVILVFLFRFKQFLKQKKTVLVSLFIALILLIPLLGSFLNQEGQARFSSVTTLTPTGTLDRSIRLMDYDRKIDSLFSVLHNRRIVYFLTAIKGYLDHFAPNFLFLIGDHSLRHHILNHGMFYIWQLPLIIIGMIYLLKKKSRYSLMLWLWLLVAPLASALTSGTPHAVRAILMVVPLTIFSAIGLWRANLMLKTKKILLLSVYLLLIILTARYFVQYYYIYPKQAARDWQYGFKQVVEFIQTENQTKLPTIVTYEYDQPHIFFMFYQQTDPTEYQQKWANNPIERFERSFDNYQFRKINWAEDQQLQDVYIVAAASEVPDNPPGLIKEIYFPDGTPAFKIIKK
ncbi:glycosyltransferase family 39 protein [Patescibacteria group bacterium]|nr:glycosyltransferase family 39 protein [Patescibacteria group bacterium]MBU1931212.1 glycosyltransferase family 39 protein [Patescibacteria group bacterium]